MVASRGFLDFLAVAGSGYSSGYGFNFFLILSTVRYEFLTVARFDCDSGYGLATVLATVFLIEFVVRFDQI